MRKKGAGQKVSSPRRRGSRRFARSRSAVSRLPAQAGVEGRSRSLGRHCCRLPRAGGGRGCGTAGAWGAAWSSPRRRGSRVRQVRQAEPVRVFPAQAGVEGSRGSRRGVVGVFPAQAGVEAPGQRHRRAAASLPGAGVEASALLRRPHAAVFPAQAGSRAQPAEAAGRPPVGSSRRRRGSRLARRQTGGRAGAGAAFPRRRGRGYGKLRRTPPRLPSSRAGGGSRPVEL